MGLDAGWIRLYALMIAVVAWVGWIGQCALTTARLIDLGRSVADAAWLLARYFTIWTNLLVAIAMTCVAIGVWPGGRWINEGRISPRGRWALRAITALTMSIVMVGVVYHVTVRFSFTPSRGWGWVFDTLLHYVTPPLCVGFWIAAIWRRGLASRLRWSDALWFLVYPLVYFAYVLIRGAATNHYPYTFVDVRKLGYGGVLLNALALTGGMLVLGLAIVGSGRVGRQVGERRAEQALDES